MKTGRDCRDAGRPIQCLSRDEGLLPVSKDRSPTLAFIVLVPATPRVYGTLTTRKPPTPSTKPGLLRPVSTAPSSSAASRSLPHRVQLINHE